MNVILSKTFVYIRIDVDGKDALKIYLDLFTQNSNSTLLHSLVIIPVTETRFSMRGLFFARIRKIL